MTHVKTRRTYDASGRQERARRSRVTVLDVAEAQFRAHGYAGTTVAAIASEAGVSTETIYKSFGGKAGLVRALHDRGLAGRGTVPAYERSDQMRERETDPHAIMREWGLLTAEVASVVTPIRLLLRSAATTDPAMAELLAESERERLARMRHHARFLKRRGHLRADVTLTEATDVLWACSSTELYELMVMQRGWSLRRFARFITDFMVAGLLERD